MSAPQISQPDRGRRLTPTPRPAPLQPDTSNVSKSCSRSQDRHGHVFPAQYDYSLPIPDPDCEYGPVDATFILDMTRVDEKDFLRVPPPNEGPPPSSSLPDFSTKILLTDEMNTAGDVPRWPGIVRLLLRIFILFAAVAVIALLAHSQSIYYKTRNIKFNGDQPAWPNTPNLFPTSFLLGIAITSVISTLLILAISFRQKLSSPISRGDKFTICSVVLFIFSWLLGVSIFYIFGKSDQTNLVWLACHRKGGPTSQIVNFDMICHEQIAAQYIGSAISVAESFVLLCFAATAVLTNGKTLWSSSFPRI